jgi:hypothetical protein
VDFGAYRKQLFERPQGEIAASAAVRNFTKWFFDLLRNFVLVGGLMYFYEKTHSTVLFYLHQGALIVIFLYCLSYADQWYINLFSFLQNQKLRHWLNIAVNLVIAIALFFVINRAATIVVAEISHAQF